MKRLSVGKVYEVQWYDHYMATERNPEQAVKHPDVILTSYGVYVGENKRYISLQYNFENPSSENNDGINIMKCAVKSTHELIRRGTV